MTLSVFHNFFSRAGASFTQVHISKNFMKSILNFIYQSNKMQTFLQINCINPNMSFQTYIDYSIYPRHVT